MPCIVRYMQLVVKCVHVRMLSCVRLFATPWTVAHEAHLSMELYRQDYWSGLPFPPPEDLPDPGMEAASSVFPALSVNSLPLNPLGSPIVKGHSV